MTILLFMFALIASAPQQHEARAAAARPATLMSGLGNLHHPIATRSREAQQFFDQGLERNPRNGRSLFGLWQALLTQGRTAEAARTEREFKQAWSRADIELKLTDF